MDSAQIQFSDGPTPAEAPVKTAERPAHVPEKFWDAATGTVKTDDLLKSYGALESKLGAPKEEPAKAPEVPPEVKPEEKPAGETEDNKPEGEKDAGEKAVEAAGLDMTVLGEHWVEHGELPADAYTKLEAIGISKEDADGYAAYKLSQAELLQTELYAPYGGDAGVDAMTKWAGENWTKEQADAFNEAANSKDRGRLDIALKGLKADFDKANGVRPKLLTPKGGEVPTGDVFASTEQFLAAQRDPRYKTDPAYRDGVIAKLARSKI